MNHCENYACNLTTCACICSNCESAKSMRDEPIPCKTCGTCPTCGRGGYVAPYYVIPPTYIPYYGQWYCYSCQMYHAYGYQCFKFNTVPYITYTLPQLVTDNANLNINYLPNFSVGIGVNNGVGDSCLTWASGVSSENGNSNS